MSMPSVETVGAFCRRYGPGRLPGANRPAVGAGYAIATAALAAAMTFVALAGVQMLLFGGSFTVTGSLTYVGLFAIPLVVPAAFVGGVVAWRVLPDSMSYRGPITGLLATVLTYVVATLPVVILMIVINPLETVRYSGLFGLVVGFFGFLFTFWLTLPIGAVSGWIHERAVSGH